MIMRRSIILGIKTDKGINEVLERITERKNIKILKLQEDIERACYCLLSMTDENFKIYSCDDLTQYLLGK